jgi:UDP-N-acetylglucosamine acyltransferase
MAIHKTAVVASSAKIHPSAEIGPYAVIEEGVTIGAETRVAAHAVIGGPSTIGERNVIHSFATVGGAPQDLSYKGEDTELIMGNGNTVREYTTIHRGTVDGGGQTVIGNDCLLMAYTHVAHDCKLGNRVIMANVATLGGHVEIGDFASLGGLVAVHQFVRIGTFSYIGGMSGIGKDVPPYMLLAGTRNRTKISGINKIGLRRAGLSNDAIRQLDGAFRLIFKTDELLKKDAFEEVLKEFPDSAEAKNLVEFLTASKRGFIQRANDD